MPTTAQRLRQRIGTVLRWAIEQGFRLDNPADAVQAVLGRQSNNGTGRVPAVAVQAHTDTNRMVAECGGVEPWREADPS